MFRMVTSAFAIAVGAVACGGGLGDCALRAISASPGLPASEPQTAMIIVRPNIYWAAPLFGVDACGGGGLFVAPLGGGPSRKISSDCVLSLTLAPDTMFWIATPLLGYLEPERLWSASLMDTSVTRHSDLARFLGAIHWTPTALLGAGGDGLMEIAADATLSRTLVANPLGVSIDAVAADAMNAYYIRSDFNGPLQQIMALPTGGGDPRAIASAPCNGCLSDLTVASGSILWIQKETDFSTYRSTGAVMSASSGAPPMELARGRPAPSESLPGGLAVADGYVYWTNLDERRGGGTIEKTPLAGGETRTVIAVRTLLGNKLAVDDRYVYFMGVADGADPYADTWPDRVIYRACR